MLLAPPRMSGFAVKEARPHSVGRGRIMRHRLLVGWRTNR